jgi:hypothetical protein
MGKKRAHSFTQTPQLVSIGRDTRVRGLDTHGETMLCAPPKFILIIFKYSVRTSQETHHVSAAETNRLILLGDTAAVYCENHTEHTNPVRTSQEKRYVSTTETNRLMLLGQTVAVYCENHTEHTNLVRTSQETHYVSTTETNRLMPFRETVF